MLSAVHKFRDAREALADALALGGDAEEILRADLTLVLALGDIGGIEREATELAAQRPSYENLVLAASVAANEGRFEDADALFCRRA